MEQTTVSYKIISAEGHTDKEQEVSTALSEIEDLVENQSKWLYINKEHITDMGNLTEQMLIDAEDIMLTNLQVGG